MDRIDLFPGSKDKNLTFTTHSLKSFMLLKNKYAHWNFSSPAKKMVLCLTIPTNLCILISFVKLWSFFHFSHSVKLSYADHHKIHTISRSQIAWNQALQSIESMPTMKLIMLSIYVHPIFYLNYSSNIPINPTTVLPLTFIIRVVYNGHILPINRSLGCGRKTGTPLVETHTISEDYGIRPGSLMPWDSGSIPFTTVASPLCKFRILSFVLTDGTMG